MSRRRKKKEREKIKETIRKIGGGKKVEEKAEEIKFSEGDIYYCLFEGHPHEVTYKKAQDKCLVRNLNKEGIPNKCEYLVKKGEAEEMMKQGKIIAKVKEKKQTLPPKKQAQIKKDSYEKEAKEVIGKDVDIKGLKREAKRKSKKEEY